MSQDGAIIGRAADCHVHVFDPRYAFCDQPRYVPEPCLRGTAAQFLRVLDAHGFSHGLIVGAAPYGGEPGPLLDAIQMAGGRLKGITLVRSELSDREMRNLADGGIVGVRFNLALGLDELTGPMSQRVLAQVRELGWFLQLHSIADDLAPALSHLKAARVRLLFDHFARPDVQRGLDQHGFGAMLELARETDAVVKLSGAFRVSREVFPYLDTDRFAEAAIGAFTLDRCVWGSDWPFVNCDERVDYGPQLVTLARWIPDAADRARVLWNNPARLFGFS
ncbi:amidohydrolase family protein [Marinivivus vitaminiproducens]|uniref:amidohydrolase family protein n=1 Tax=Marinivivus vitaminiproducens TaxID=3035935 RepID=UPI0027AB7750|nr:amidohydrolase family protein [Geminicoccaceae bacterium SCSIO 64248]